MSGPIFVLDAQGRPLMPVAPAHARKLLRRGMAHRHPHYAFTILKLERHVEQPSLRPVLLDIAIHRHTAELYLVAEGARGPIPLLWLLVDLQTDLARRLRRRAGHRRRRKARQRYHAPPYHGIPFKLRRLSLARSRWARQHRRKRAHHQSELLLAPTIRWRVQAILRTIATLQKLVPLSHVIIRSPRRANIPAPAGATLAEQRERRLSKAAVPACAYCGATEGRLELDHAMPRSHGGSNALDNLVLACAMCNARKADTISAAAPQLSGRRRLTYLWQTAYLLHRALACANLDTSWLSIYEAAEPSLERLSSFPRGAYQARGRFIVKPIPRPRKQRFTSRNYPLSTPLRPPFVRVGTTVKRLVRVNQRVHILRQSRRTILNVVSVLDRTQKAEGQGVRLGILCEASRADRLVTGIVGAIHSSGRLTLRVPFQASTTGISWQDVVVSPRAHLRVRSSDRVIFLSLPDNGVNVGEAREAGDD